MVSRIGSKADLAVIKQARNSTRHRFKKKLKKIEKVLRDKKE
jgi:hypothetical protein